MTDPVSVALVGLGADLYRRLIGPSADEGGEFLKEYTRLGLQRLRDRLTGAQRLVQKAGAEGRQVPAKVLDPLLRGASLEEDDELAVAWEALIANAAIGDPDRQVLARFPTILTQLGSDDAKLLQFLFENPNAPPEDKLNLPDSDVPYWQRETLASHLGFDRKRLDVVCDVLFSFSLLEREAALRTFWDGQATATDQTGVHLSELGRRFVGACTPPEASR